MSDTSMITLVSSQSMIFPVTEYPPGSLTTTETVKKVMMEDHCTWDHQRMGEGLRQNVDQGQSAVYKEKAYSRENGCKPFGIYSVNQTKWKGQFCCCGRPEGRIRF